VLSFDRTIQNAGYYLSKELIDIILEKSGEDKN